ncbi:MULTISPECIES: FadR/GntR family transcriptional regulator [unclassified Mesorhizobium]|uniref:FadR/GntR family transcriptional regulator n=1 Tax=unclassified Mesorhizobium TaxID=325217 RepID=UPI00086AA887|nr:MULTISPECIES: FadR/GntR family transcriptional regulator [unclassified Mesorhizobium]MBN9258001.1 FadR family transcriptional regulator [Mesorhizobium sp.]MBN9270556.1 FadR family transcriptional regulator [Mesorhizobium sp.]ODT17082.1 MAG: GntR family transcriptional regulator [Mesorhizobium sp. SCN 65-12]OJX82677.1 MAG: GntR family transcriptional regulator [Mesorhizobium sp. 65-26]
MRTATKTSLTDSAAENLRAEIVSGRWCIGERIPNEASLADLLSVSRGTVREAVRMLVSQGLLDTRQGSGTYVRSAVDPSAALDRVKRSGLRDQWEARAALDVEAARLAALRHTPADLARMRQLLAERGTVTDGGRDAFIHRDIAFHKSIVVASGNRAMMELYDFFTAAITETVRATLDGDLPEPDQQAHAAIVDAVASRDPERAVAAVRAFMAPVLAQLERLLSP